MNPFKLIALLLFLVVLAYPPAMQAQTIRVKDSVVYKITYRDTVIHRYKYDTVRIKHYVHTDTVWTNPVAEAPAPKRKHAINPNNWGIGPSVGAYYSPINGFDVNIGFGIQYYILAIPSFRNPHLGHRRNRK
ncbi:MAG: hypothetical protein JSS79_08205 [Bacteroidetes bacterium]|nr:hypothetical protein [Bacteroidota bacterium]